jgi:DNA mismatch repair protein MutH
MSLRELEIRAEALAGRTLGELARALDVTLPDARRAKGFVGQLVELALGADPSAGDGPDFPTLDVELKTIPVGRNGRPKESTFVCSVTMATAEHERWETSRLRRRLQRVVWVPVEAADVADLALRRIGRPVVWSPSPEEEAALRADWEHLMGAVGAGRGGSLSAHEGTILQLRPKARDGAVRTLAPDDDGVGRLLPLGFYLRASFTAHIVRAPTFAGGAAC